MPHASRPSAKLTAAGSAGSAGVGRGTSGGNEAVDSMFTVKLPVADSGDTRDPGRKLSRACAARKPDASAFSRRRIELLSRLIPELSPFHTES